LLTGEAVKKGQRATEEFRQKVADARRGKGGGKWSPERRAAFKERMAQSDVREHLLERAQSQRGRKLSPEHIAKIKAGHARPEVRQRASETHKGKKLTPEHIASIKAGWNRPGVREHAAESHRGHKLSPEHAAAIADSQRTPEARAAMSELMKQMHATDADFHERQRQGTIASLLLPERRAKHREAMRKLHASPEYRAKLAEQRRAWLLGRSSSLELLVQAWLDKHNVAYVRQERIRWYVVDFFVPALNLVIEANGCYWHSCQECGFHDKRRMTFEKRRTAFLLNHGYALAVVWEHAAKRGDFSALTQALRL
jgi:very-short-patch-repair endonuclease